jgi:DNA-binding NarL/FixJ family response regulator
VIYLYPATSRGASLWSMNPGTHRRSANHLDRGSAGQRLPAHLCPVLEQLLLGVPDATASRRLNMSPRTFSRRVAELLELLGVATRFQGGVLAAQLGWTPAPDEGYQVPQVIAAERH